MQIFHVNDRGSTVPRARAKDLVVRKSGENQRWKLA